MTKSPTGKTSQYGVCKGKNGVGVLVYTNPRWEWTFKFDSDSHNVNVPASFRFHLQSDDCQDFGRGVVYKSQVIKDLFFREVWTDWVNFPIVNDMQVLAS